MSNMDPNIHKLVKYGIELLSKRGIKINDFYSFLVFRIGSDSLNNAIDIAIDVVSEKNRVDSFTIYSRMNYYGVIHTFRDFLKKKGWSKKKIDEFCKDIESNYKQLEKEITYII